MNQKNKRIYRRLTDEERALHAKVIEQVKKEFPPLYPNGRPVPPGIPSQIRQARKAKGLSWYALAKQAGIPNPATIRDMELGKDVKLSSLKAVAAVLGLHVELVEAGH